MAWRFVPPPDARTATRTVMQRILSGARRSREEGKKPLHGVEQRVGDNGACVNRLLDLLGRGRRCGDEIRRSAERAGGEHITRPVAREHRSRGGQIELGDGLIEELASRLPAAARPAYGGGRAAEKTAA